MFKALRHIVLLLVAVAIIGGTTTELARSAQYAPVAAAAGMPCDMTMPAPASGDEQPMQPCKGMTPDCIKMMGCVTATALPPHSLTHQSTVRYSAIVYWTPVSALSSSDLEPEPLPPRTA
jgi:hypothetical protein